MSKEVTCHKCKKEFVYNEAEDEKYNDLVPISGRKVVVDENKNSFPIYAIPPDKRRLVNPDLIKIECTECLVIIE